MAGSQPANASLHAVVRGRVQGVFFRYFVERHARTLGVKGFVRNLPDGKSVEVMAEGAKARLEQLLTDLQAGPPGARVDAVDVTWGEPSGAFENFETRR